MRKLKTPLKILGVGFEGIKKHHFRERKLLIQKYSSDILKPTHPEVQEASNKSSETMMASEPDRLNLGRLLQDHQPMRDTVIRNYK